MVVGLAGKSCSGKNALTDILHRKGWEVEDMDLRAHRVLNDLAPRAAALFGEAILRPGGEVDRAALGRIVFADQDALKRLEDLLYPELHKSLDQRLALRHKNSPPLAVNAAALEKQDFWKKCDLILWVSAPVLVRLVRAWRRDRKPLADLIKRFHAQRELKPQFFFQRVDTYIIKNGGNRKSLEKRVDRWLQTLPPE